MLRHLEDSIHGLPLRGLDKTAGVDDQNLGLIGTRRELVAFARQNAHHHLTVHEVFGTSQGNKSNFTHTVSSAPIRQSGYFSTSAPLTCFGAGPNLLQQQAQSQSVASGAAKACLFVERSEFPDSRCQMRLPGQGGRKFVGCLRFSTAKSPFLKEAEHFGVEPRRELRVVALFGRPSYLQ